MITKVPERGWEWELGKAVRVEAVGGIVLSAPNPRKVACFLVQESVRSHFCCSPIVISLSCLYRYLLIFMGVGDDKGELGAKATFQTTRILLSMFPNNTHH